MKRESMVVRPLRREDMPRMADLLSDRDELNRETGERRAAILEWVAFSNPYRKEGEPSYYVVEGDGRILAMHGRMPVLFSLNGSLKKGYYVHDLYVHRDARDAGLGFWMTMAIADATEEGSDSFLTLFGMTPLNFRMQKMRDYREMKCDSFAKLLWPDDALKKFVGNDAVVRVLSLPGRAILRSADVLLLPRRGKGLPVFRSTSFGKGFDDLFARVAPKIGFCTARTAAYLNWKYGEGPSRNDAVIAAGDRENLRGYIIAGFSPHGHRRGGIIKDFIVDPEDTEAVHALMNAAIGYFRRNNARSVRVISTNPRFGEIFKRYLFVKMKEPETVFLGNLAKSPIDPAALLVSGNWHFMYGESDIFMYSGGIPPEKKKS